MRDQSNLPPGVSVNDEHVNPSDRYDLTGAIMDYESGQLSSEDTVTLFQYLVDTGMAWRLQGSYGRQAQAMIDHGTIQGPHSRAR